MNEANSSQNEKNYASEDHASLNINPPAALQPTPTHSPTLNSFPKHIEEEENTQQTK